MTSPLRLGLALDRVDQPRWVCDLLEALEASAFADLGIVLRYTAGPPAALGPPPPLAHRLYSAVDRTWLGQPSGPLERVGLGEWARTRAAVSVDRTDGGDQEAAGALRTHATDVLLDLTAAGVPAEVARAARYGTWSFTPPAALGLAEGAAGRREVFEAEPVTRVAVAARGWAADASSEPRDPDAAALFESVIRTHAFSAQKNRAASCRELAAGLLGQLRALHALGPDALAPAARPPLATPEMAAAPPTSEPAPRAIPKGAGAARAMRQLAGVGARTARTMLRRSVSFDQWSIAYQIGGERPWSSDALASFRRLTPPKDRFWADPFPYVRDGRHYIFLEEHLYDRARGGHGKGHISIVEVDASGPLRAPAPVLALDDHLSYPFLFEWEGELFMLPETALAGRLTLYRCRAFPFAWEPEAVLLDGVRIVDATLVEHGGRWWMLGGVETDDGIRFDGLHVFQAPTPLGPWVPHVRNPQKSDVRSARPAGALFHHGGALYRPAQDGSRRYGYAVTIHRVTRLDEHAFTEEPVAHLRPTWDDGLLAVHTLNVAGALAVVDGRYSRRRYP